MKAIETTYRGPTDSTGARVRAKEPDGGYVTIPWDHSLDAEGNHVAAAKALCAKMGWVVPALLTGWNGGGRYVHVLQKAVLHSHVEAQDSRGDEL